MFGTSASLLGALSLTWDLGPEALAQCAIIIAARVVDVSLGTIRTVTVFRGRRVLATVLGFFEILVWVFAVSQVITNLQEPVYAIAYAIGFALGNFAGLTLERSLISGDEMVFFFSRRGEVLAAKLREFGHGVTQFSGAGRDGPITMLLVQTRRRKLNGLLGEALGGDPDCFYIIQGVRDASSAPGRYHQPTGWRAVMKKK